MFAVCSFLFAVSGPTWIGVEALDSSVPLPLVQRLQLEASNTLGLHRRQQADLDGWRQRLAAIDASFRQGNLRASHDAVIRLIADVSDPAQPWLEGIDVLAKSLLMLGQIQLLLDDELGAAAAFQGHHALRPDRAPDPALYRPVVIKAYDQLGRAILAGTQRNLQVEARPAGATVWLDGTPRGQAPMTLTGLLPGRHYLRVVAGARSVQQVVDLGTEGSVVTADLGADAQTAGTFFAAWRLRQGFGNVQRAAQTSGRGHSKFAVGIERRETSYQAVGVRLGPTGEAQAVVVVPLGDSEADLDFKAFTGLVRMLRDGGGAQSDAALLGRSFGHPPNTTRPIVVGVLVSGIGVALAAVVVLGLMNQDGSGIVIDPEGVR